jgi:acetyltransferase
MSIRNLDAIFKPKSVALIGASTKDHSVGAVIARNLLAGGFDGPIMPVNPSHTSVAGVLCYPDAAHLPLTPDLAIICTPAPSVPQLIADLGARGTRGAIVVTAGFAEGGSDSGRTLERAMLDAARPTLMRIVGPNCLGVITTPAKLNASFSHIPARTGGVAFVAQSGAIITTVLDWADARGLGFSHLVSLGDMADVDFGDMLDYLASDPATTSILLYVEAITQARKFMSAARAASRLKPVIVIKAGREPAGAKAASSHTGALAGIDGVYDAAFQRAGTLRVHDLDELFDAVETLAMRPPVKGDRLAILTNGGGAGVLATDSLLEQGGRLAELDAGTLAKLDACLPGTWSHGNPVDIIGDAPGSRYTAALNALLEAPDVDAILVLNCPTAVASGLDAAQAVVATARGKERVVLTNWLGANAAEPARKLIGEAGMPTYDTPENAVRGFMHLVRYRRVQANLMEVPPSIPSEFTPDEAGAREIVRAALAAGESWLNAADVCRLLACYRIPVARTFIVATPDEAAAKAKEIAATVALKIFSPDITHKSDVGGVVLDLETPDAVRAAAIAMQARVAKVAPSAHLTGFVVQEMIRRPGAYELIAGMAADVQFGPFLLFGHGGTAVEVIDDKALALPPLNMNLARETMSRTRIYRQLAGFRDTPPAALDAIALTLVQLSQLVCDLDEVVELDINPLLADAKGVIAVDARLKLAVVAPGARRGARLSIRPYPKELEHIETVAGFGEMAMRPIRPEDAPLLTRFAERLEPEDVRMRFFSPLRTLPQPLLARLTQIDYDREMAFVLFDSAAGIAGVARFAADPNNAQAEYAVIVRSDLKRRGLGRLLMQRIVAYAKARGIGFVFGDVLEENTGMLALCRDLGCSIAPLTGSPGILRATLTL